MRRAAALAALAVLGGCGGGAKPAPPARTPAPTPKPAATATPIAIAPSDQAACASLYARLQRVTLALSSSSELIAQSVNTRDLGTRISTERQQLVRSARLMDDAVVPAPLTTANKRLVTALRTFAGDFARAQAPAKRGDFPAAVQAMTDKPAVQRIIAAATTIQKACQA
jgi:hypothetical protein